MRIISKKVFFFKSKALLLCIVCALTSVVVNCQVTEVIYRRKFLTKHDYSTRKVTQRLLFNDTIAFAYFSLNKKMLKLSFEKVIEKDHFAHSLFLFAKGKPSAYLISTIFSSEQSPWLSRFSSNVDLVEYRQKEKEILGIACKEALVVNGRNDTILIFYTEAIKKPFGPDGIVFKDGLVLEATYMRDKMHFFASSIKNIDDTIFLPSNFRIVSDEEFEKAKRQRQAELNAYDN
jgi:GLPGLI family protein